MEVSADLAPEALMDALPGRPVRTYPAMLATEPDALAWARTDAADGAVVVAEHQAAPRGRAGLVWRVAPERDLAFSVVLRPHLSVEREGWLYTLATTALAELGGEEATIAWPDEVRRADGTRAAAVGVHVELGPRAVAWAVATMFLPGVAPRRAEMLARVVAALEAHRERPADEVLADHRARCETIGRRVSARLIPMGPNGQRVTGTAVTTLKDGALVIATDDERRVAVRPQSLGLLDDG